MRKLEIVATASAFALVIVADSWYCWHVVRGPLTPALATWLIFAVATTLSLLSYLKHNDGRHPFIANAANRVDPFIVWAVVVCMLFAPRADRSIHLFDAICLGASGVIGSLWYAAERMNISAKRATILANLLINLIMVAGYLPTAYKIFIFRVNGESFVTWGLNLLIASLLLIAPLARRDWLSVLYIGRAVVCVALILTMMLWFDHAWFPFWAMPVLRMLH